MRKIKTNLKFYRTSAVKSAFRKQNNTDLANFRYTANKKYRSCLKIRFSALDKKCTILHLSIRSLYFPHRKMFAKWHILNYLKNVRES